MHDYWTWWQGALALGALTIIFVFMMGRMLGVSGSWGNVIYWRDAQRRQTTAKAMRVNAGAMHDALMAATLAEFGAEKTQALLAGQGSMVASAAVPHSRETMVEWTAHLTFLAFMLIGGMIAATLNGHFAIQLDLGAAHTALFGRGWTEWLTLLGGGILVGFGTQMGGGCTSGHGLSGVSRLTPASLVATTVFFACGVATSFLLEGIHL
jgi:uncharacterized membrane protein YedE/YeeE